MTSKLTYVLVPLVILGSGMTVIRKKDGQQKQRFEGLHSITDHLTAISAEPPIDLNFCEELVPLDNPEVKDKIEYELHQNLFYRSSAALLIKRANRYRGEFVPILQKHGVPEDFFYLSVAESGLSNAISPVGAKGFWQFMSATGAHYGLEISATVDERYHPAKSAEAAARYLSDLYDRFGDWQLVAAAYNMGPGGLSRAVRHQQTEDYFELDLNSETGRYLYRILGFKTLLEDPLRYGFNLKEVYEPISYRTVRVSKNLPSLKRFAKQQGVKYDLLKLMNPWLTSHSLQVKPGKTYEIRLPLETEIKGRELEVYDPRDLRPVINSDTLELDEMDARREAQDSVKTEQLPDSLTVQKPSIDEQTS